MRFRIPLALALALSAGLLFTYTRPSAQDIEDRLSSLDATERAAAVHDLCRTNEEREVERALEAIRAEYDGPAGYAMCNSVQLLTSEEAYEAILKEVPKWDKREDAIGAVWVVTGIARQRTETADKLLWALKEEIGRRDYCLHAAFWAALGMAERKDLGDRLIPALKECERDGDGDELLLALTLIDAAPQLARTPDVKKDDKAKKPAPPQPGKPAQPDKKDEDEKQPDKPGDPEVRNNIVLALADILEESETDRVRWHTLQALSAITGLAARGGPDKWRFWATQGGKGMRNDDEGHSFVKGDPPPTFFGAPIVGKRVVFIIDYSSSMSVETKINVARPGDEDEADGPTTGRKDKRKGKDEPEGPDYSGVKTRMDLAKVELIYSIESLDEDVFFNVVMFNNTHKYLIQNDEKFVQATPSAKKKFIKAVEDISYMGGTNIHGPLNRAYCINRKRSLDPAEVPIGEADPATDADCFDSGATTIFLLSDGSPGNSDDPIDQQPRDPNQPFQRARMCEPENLALHIRRMNIFRKTVVHTIDLTGGSSTLLARLAKEGRGVHIVPEALQKKD